MILLCHAFHCLQVHCLMVCKYMIEDREEMNQKPDDEDDTFLAIVHKEGHFGVVQVDLIQHEVYIWDAVETKPHKIPPYWQKHIKYIVERLKADEVVMEHGMVKNLIPSSLFRKKKEKKTQGVDGCPWWKVNGVVPRNAHRQQDAYTCGPIAINHFASMLSEMSTKKGNARTKVTDTDLLVKIHSPDTSMENSK